MRMENRGCTHLIGVPGLEARLCYTLAKTGLDTAVPAAFSEIAPKLALLTFECADHGIGCTSFTCPTWPNGRWITDGRWLEQTMP